MIFVFALAAIIFWKVLRPYFQFVFDVLTAIVKLLWGFWMRYWQRAADKAEGRAASQAQVAAVMNPAPVKRLLPMGWVPQKPQPVNEAEARQETRVGR